MIRAKILSLAVAVSAFALPMTALAQQTPSVPSYARPAVVSNEDVVKGRIISFDGKYKLELQDDRGFVDVITLHQGTIINPTGLTLSPGMSVTIRGVNRGRELAANQIDTPYNEFAATPVYPYYPYSPYGYPSSRFSVGIGIGGFGGYYGHSRWY